MSKQISLTFYSDVLCLWAYISQTRIDEVAGHFSDHVAIRYRFCSVFGNTAHKIGEGWKERGGYAGFATHLHESAAAYKNVTLHPELWQTTRPASSGPAHLLLKAVQRVEPQQCEAVLCELRNAFFGNNRDIGNWAVLKECLEVVEVSVGDVKEVINGGLAHADLESDYREQRELLVQGSPTILLNEGRQKLYGNVGYGVIEANIHELLRLPTAGAASWC